MNSQCSGSTIAIVIPAFNRERFIAAAIESALAQTVPADEIIVVDDGSTDRTGLIASGYGPPVRVIRIENNGAGPSRPRNVGIAAAQSKYITLLDSDDRLAPTVLQRHREILERYPQLGLICNNFCKARWVGNGLENLTQNEATVVSSLERERIGPNTYLIRSRVAYRAYLSGNFVCTPGATLPKGAWEEIGGFDETLRTSNDYDFFLRLLRRHDMAYIDDPLQTVVHHDGNISAANLTRRFVPELCLNPLRVWQRELQYATCAEHRRALRGSIRRRLLDLAYTYRHMGSYLASAATCLKYLCWGGNLWIGLMSMSKVPVCCLLRLLGRPHRAASSPDGSHCPDDTPSR